MLVTKTALARSFLLADPEPSADNDFPTSAIVGLVVGVVLMGLLGAATFFWIYRRRQGQREGLHKDVAASEVCHNGNKFEPPISLSEQRVATGAPGPPHYSDEDLVRPSLRSPRTTSPTSQSHAIYELAPFGDHPAERGERQSSELLPISPPSTGPILTSPVSLKMMDPLRKVPLAVGKPLL